MQAFSQKYKRDVKETIERVNKPSIEIYTNMYSKFKGKDPI